MLFGTGNYLKKDYIMIGYGVGSGKNLLKIDGLPKRPENWPFILSNNTWPNQLSISKIR
jgi:hypothetical protein